MLHVLYYILLYMCGLKISIYPPDSESPTLNLTPNSPLNDI